MYILVLVVLISFIVFGPRAKVVLFWKPSASRVQLGKMPEEITSADLKELRKTISDLEYGIPEVPDGAEKSISFSSESRPKRTKYCVLYVHGYSATRQEISPVPENIAKALHANYYGTRLTGHGLDGETLADTTANDWLFDITEAWHVAHQLGEKVIVISTSTGGTLSTWLAQQPEVKPHLAALIMVSPNFQPKHWATPLFLWPWSRYWMPLLGGDTHGWEPSNESGAKYWTYRYPVRSIHTLAALVKEVRKSKVEQISAPSLFLYCDHDQVVNSRFTDAIMRRWGARTKHRISVPARANDNNHVVTGDIVNPTTTEQFTHDILTFLKTYVVQK